MVDWLVSWLMSFPYSFGQQTVYQVLCWVPRIWNWQRHPEPSLSSLMVTSWFLGPGHFTFFEGATWPLQNSLLGKRTNVDRTKQPYIYWSTALPCRSRASIQGLVDWHSLKALSFMPQHCPFGSHTATATLRHMFLQTRWLFLPSA